ncbi:zinc finger, CCHC-type containing protein [Tanacetum coccineum]
MDIKIAFLNGDLEEEVYMKQLEGSIMPGKEHKVCKLIKSLFGLKQAPKQWHRKFDKVVLSSGFILNQSDQCVYCKFDKSCNGVIICLYVDDMLIFGTDQDQVDKTKEFLSLNFSMRGIGEADVILVSTPLDPTIKLMPNIGRLIDQLEYSRAIGCLMYAMTSTRLDIAYDVGKLSRYTSNLSTHYLQAIMRVFKYLKKTMDYGLSYIGFPSVLEGYSDASWITNSEDHTSITETEFVALAAAGKEAEWLRNLIYEILVQELKDYLCEHEVLSLQEASDLAFICSSKDGHMAI